jgi:hypothetical protein
MSPEAVAARLHDVASLYELGMSLATARVLGPVEERTNAPPIVIGDADKSK